MYLLIHALTRMIVCVKPSNGAWLSAGPMLTTKLHMTFKLSLDINVLGYLLAHETRSWNYRGTSSIVTHWGMCPLLLTLMPEWISNYSKWWDEIIYPFPNFNDSTVEVWKWISHFITYFIMEWNNLSTLRIKLNHVSKRSLWWYIYASVK